MARKGWFLAVLGSFLLAGCVSGPEGANKVSDTDVLIDPNRPAPEYGEVVTGPAVGPDLNATTASAPRLVVGEWWRIRFENAEQEELVRVVAATEGTGYIFGMPHEGWYKEAIAFHAPAFGDVASDLSYSTHNVKFEPLRFPLVEGATWETEFATTPYTAKVTRADAETATILFTPPATEPTPTDPLNNALGLSGAAGTMELTYDARQHEVVKMESWIGDWEVVEHGYDFQGWVTVPRGEHTAIDYGASGPSAPDQSLYTRTVVVDGGFNRMTMMHVVYAITPGQYRLSSVAPQGDRFVTETDQGVVFKFYEARDPDGAWTQEDWVAGVGGTYTMGIAYHQYDISLPDGQRRADHSHPVIR